jgi:hypothetical protein
MTFEALTVVSVKIAVFWDMTLCSLLDGLTSQSTIILMKAVFRNKVVPLSV